MTTLICSCNETMPLDQPLLAKALNEPLPMHSLLCRRQAPEFQKTLVQVAQRGDPAENLVVACTQEQKLFSELASHTEGAQGLMAPIKFINIRETGGWSKDAAKAMPKIAALLAAAHLPDPEPVSTVTYKSAGRLLIVGELQKAEAAAALLRDSLDLSIFSTGWASNGAQTGGQIGGQIGGQFGEKAGWQVGGQGGEQGGVQNRDHTVMAGKIDTLSGWLGAFKLTWQTSNPIDLDMCTRCNACVQVCPEQAIGLDYQIDMNKCQSHRACVLACDAAGAIDFGRAVAKHEQSFDLVLDLSTKPLIDWHAAPQGYFSVPAAATAALSPSSPSSPHSALANTVSPEPVEGLMTATLMKLKDMVGEFEKPKFFNYKQKICAHSRNTTVGCNACVEVCSAHAISSDTKRQQIVVNPNLCVGCGACTTVCPTGALTYTYPRANDQGSKIKTLLSTYAKAGGVDGTLLLHSQEAGQKTILALGRAVQTASSPLKSAPGKFSLFKPAPQSTAAALQGVPHNVIPVAMWHTASTGLDIWLSALCWGASKVAVLVTGEEAPDYLTALKDQMAVGQTLLEGLGFSGQRLHLIEAQFGAPLASLDALQNLDKALYRLSHEACSPTLPAARFGIGQEKRATLEMALDHLMEHAPALKPMQAGSASQASPPTAIALPARGSPFGAITVDTAKCTMCLSCVSSCPAAALKEHAESLQLQFIEKNCVQCGLCEQTCPESAIQLMPQLLLGQGRKEPKALNTAKMFHCIRCAKPFGTEMAITNMFTKLAGHSMFQGMASERLKMCMDCRVIDLHSADNEAKITGI